VDYKVYFGTDPTPDSGEYEGIVTGSSFSLPNLNYYTTYYWKIIAVDEHGAETSGPVWKFTTEDEPNYVPDAPLIYTSTTPSSLYPIKTYDVQVLYTDQSGAADLKTVYLRLAQNDSESTNRQTLMWSLGGDVVQWNDEDHHITASAIKSSATNGYSVTWTIELDWDWEESSNVDFWAWAVDDINQESAHTKDNSNSTYENDIIVSSSEISNPVTVGDNYIVNGSVYFQNTTESPIDFTGISVELRKGSTTGTLLYNDNTVSSGFNLVWTPTDNDIGTQNVYVLPKNTNHQPPISSTYYDVYNIQVDPEYGNINFFIDEPNPIGAAIIIYDIDESSSWTEVADEYGTASFRIPVGDYPYDVLSQETYDITRELWASGYLNLTTDGLAETVKRSYPYVSSTNCTQGPDYYEVSNSLLKPNESYNLNLYCKNLYSAAYSARITLWLDENKASSFDYGPITKEVSITANDVSIVSFPIDIDPSWAGKRMYMKVMIESYINGSWQQTDYIDWSDYNWYWDIDPNVDLDPPTVTEVFPANNDLITANALSQSGIIITFSETIDESTLNSNTFNISDGTNTISGTFSYEFSGLGTYYFYPDNTLEDYKTYTCNLTTGIKDNAGNNLQSNYDWSFQVMPQGYYSSFNIFDGQTNKNNVGSIRLKIYESSSNWNNLVFDEISQAGVLLTGNIPEGDHPYELIDQIRNEYWGTGSISVSSSSNTFTLDRSAPYETGIHRPYIDSLSALNRSTDPADYYSASKLVGVGQKVYIPVTVKNPSWTKNVKTSVYVNDNQSYEQTTLNSQIASVNGYGGENTFVFAYTVPDSYADSTILNIDVKIEAEYNSLYKLVDNYNGWEQFRVTKALPKVVDQFPNINAINVPVTTPIEIHFSMDMEESTLENPDNFLLSDGTNYITADSIVYKQQYGYAVFYPSENLQFNTQYTVTAKAIMQNLAGLSLDGNNNSIQDGSPVDDYIFSFITSDDINKVRLEVPYYTQSSSSWCGYTSLAMILSYYKYDMKPWEVAGYFNKSMDVGVANGIRSFFNTSTSDLENYLESDFGDGSNDMWVRKTCYSNKVFKNVIISSLLNNNPVWIGSIDSKHAIVATGFSGTSDNDSVFIHDPSGIYPNTIGSFNCINYGSTWDELIQWVDSDWGSIFGDVKLIYLNSHLTSTQSNLSLEVARYTLSFQNMYNNVLKELILNWDGSINSEGYYYETLNEGAEWYPVDNFYNVQLSSTQADILKIKPYYFNFSISNEPIKMKIGVEIYDVNNNLISSYSSNYHLIKKHDNTLTSFYFYDIIPDFELVDLNPGNYVLMVKAINENGNLLDKNEFDFSVAPSEYSKLRTQIIGERLLKIIKGDIATWDMSIKNEGTQKDEFYLLNHNINYSDDTCRFFQNGEIVNITPILLNGGSQSLEIAFETSDLDVGSIDTIITTVRSKLDPCKLKNDTLIIEVVDCINPYVNFDLPTDICTGETVNVVDNSSNIHSSAVYNWDVDGDGVIDYNDVGTISHTYNTAGTYSISLTIDQNIGCSGSKTKSITVHEVIADAGDDISVCEGDQVILSAAGGEFYEWDNGVSQNNPFIPATTTTYTVTATDSYGCNATDQVEVIVNNIPEITTEPTITNSSCGNADGSVTGIIANGSGLNYEWKNAEGAIIGTSSELNNVTAGIYSVKVKNASGCFTEKTYTVNNEGAPGPPVAESPESYCEGEDITPLSATGTGGTLTWYSDPGLSNILGTGDELVLNAEPTETTNYYVTETTSCESAPTKVTVTINQLPLLDLGPDKSLCDNETAALNPGYFNSYLWSTGSTQQHITVNSAGDYWVQVTDYNSCSNSDTIKVELSSSYYENSNISICNGETYEFGSQLISAPGTYTELFNSKEGCDSLVELNLTVNPTYNFTSSNSICSGEVYNWQNQELTESGTYTTTYSTFNGCDSIYMLDLVVNEPISVFIGNDTSIYENQSITLNAGSDFLSYLWSNGSTGSMLVVNGNIGLGLHEFSVEVIDNNGCSSTDIITILILSETDNNTPIAHAGTDIETNEGLQVELDGTGSYDPDGNSITYSWTSLDGITLSNTTLVNPVFTAPEVTLDSEYRFTLTVNDGDLISEKDTVVVTVLNVEGNQAPVANAGSDIETDEGLVVTLDGAGSYDPDGSPIIYSWESLNGIALSNYIIENPIFTAPEVSEDNDYFFTLEVTDGELVSQIDTVKVTVLNTTGIVQIRSDETIKIYPNPTKDKFYLEFSEKIDKKILIEIISLSGEKRLVKSFDKSIDESILEIDISNYSQGIYLVKIYYSNRIKTRKIMLE